jgi:hypothetical protein
MMPISSPTDAQPELKRGLDELPGFVKPAPGFDRNNCPAAKRLGHA